MAAAEEIWCNEIMLSVFVQMRVCAQMCVCMTYRPEQIPPDSEHYQDPFLFFCRRQIFGLQEQQS